MIKLRQSILNKKNNINESESDINKERHHKLVTFNHLFNSLNNQIKNEQNEINTLKQNINNLSLNQIKQQKEENNQLEQQCNSLKNQCNQLKQQQSKLATKLNKLKNEDIVFLKDKKANLLQQTQEINKRIQRETKVFKHKMKKINNAENKTLLHITNLYQHIQNVKDPIYEERDKQSILRINIKRELKKQLNDLKARNRRLKVQLKRLRR